MADFADSIRRRLGARVKELRLARHLTQEALAERAGLSYKFVGEIERGAANPSVSTLAAVANGLGVGVDDLFREEPRAAYMLSPRELLVVRDAIDSLEDVMARVEPARKRRRRGATR